MAKKLKPILVVSNRTDKRLQRSLSKQLVAKIIWVVAKQRRIQSACQSIENGKYRMVIILTGFLNHKVTAMVEESAKKSETPFVRANRGRPAAVERAMERDLAKNGTEHQTERDL